MVIIKTKSIYKSKTVWFNLVMTIILSAQLIGGMYENLTGITALVAGLGNIVIRVWFTKQGIIEPNMVKRMRSEMMK